MAVHIPPGWFGSPLPETPVLPDSESGLITKSQIRSLLQSGYLIRWPIKIEGRAAYLITLAQSGSTLDLTPNLRASVHCGHLLYGSAVLILPDDKLEVS